MADKKNKGFKDVKKDKPAVNNDQLGENSGEGRIMKNNKSGKCP